MINVLTKVWDRNEKEWLADRHAILSDGSVIINFDGKEWVKPTNPKYYYVVQYVGSHDKNNSPAFDGDIIQFSFGAPSVLVVAPIVFINGGFFVLTPKCNPDRCLVEELKNHVGEFEIIGNIFENPKLLEG